MIQITDKKNCCGCYACVQACPKQCISFEEDQEGFHYPLVNKDLCIECGLCEKVCPCLNQTSPKSPLKLYAAINPNEEVRLSSSSGGIFSMIAETIINAGGVVFGARFDDNWEVKHDYTDTIEGIKAFCGSKYVQSRIGGAYNQTLSFLKSGRKVLFSGTSCQISGLRHFLRQNYENLFTVDVICHGSPSPLVWRNYLDEVVDGFNNAVHNVEYRNKAWKQYKFSVQYDGLSNVVSLSSRHQDNAYMHAFLQNIILRPSCYNCPAKQGKSLSDITLADFWGIQNVAPEMNDDKGVSLIIINTEKGKEFYHSLSLRGKEVDEEIALKGNWCYYNSVAPHNQRDFLFRGLSNGQSFHGLMDGITKQTKPHGALSILSRSKRLVSKILHIVKRRGMKTYDINVFTETYPHFESNSITRKSINSISFRNKKCGWKYYQMVMDFLLQ